MDITLHESALPYLVSRPERGRARAALPLLVFLHGYDEGAPLDIHAALTRHGPLAGGAWPGATERFIVVAPQLPRRGDLWRLFGDAVREIVREVSGRHGVDPRRTFLTGFSFGGNGVFDLGLAQPDLWSALWAVDPTRVPGDRMAMPVWLSSGSISRLQATDFLIRLGLEKPDPERPGPRIFEDAGSDHVGTARLAYAAPRTYEWLLSRSTTPAG
jgi:hypothetical protein